MQTRLLPYLTLSLMLAAAGCKEDYEPSQIPTIPTKLSLEDGAEITDLTVTLNANGSTVEDENLKVSYVYYIGTSADDLVQTSAEVTLEPFTQYFWRAQAKTQGGEGEMTELRTFYCIPDTLELTSNNGYGDWAAVIHWDNADKFKSVTITATPDHEGYSLESQTVESGADSCYFKTIKPENDAYTHWWDEAKGIYYEPVIYTFNVEAVAQVGDKSFTFNSSVKEILLDNEYEVRDHEFNVYRMQRIGSQTWLADDLRVTTFLDGSPIQGITTSTLESGATGLLYHTDCIYKLTSVLPKGYHLSTNEDWLELESFYGVTTDSVPEFPNYSPNYLRLDTTFSSSYFNKYRFVVGEEQHIGTFLQCGCGVWKKTNETNQSGERTAFNAMPFGMTMGDQNTNHISALYFAGRRDSYTYYFREIWAYSTGICRGYSYYTLNPSVSIRLVKD